MRSKATRGASSGENSVLCIQPPDGRRSRGPALSRYEEASMSGAARQFRAVLWAIPMVLLPGVAKAQGTQADYQRATSVNDRLTPLILGQPSAPEWLGQSSRF